MLNWRRGGLRFTLWTYSYLLLLLNFFLVMYVYKLFSSVLNEFGRELYALIVSFLDLLCLKRIKILKQIGRRSKTLGIKPPL